ncbi:hypothetical protein HK096_009368 [Nowakowskiella sp. JEL0078]|nr:hypothetical protein HK096_009368 [Nowakowskiella sp. JEL0078]
MSHDASDSWFGLLSASRLFAKLEKNAVANRLVPARSTSLYPEAAAALRAIPPNLPSPNSPPLHSDFVQFAVWYSSLFPAASRPTPTEIQTAWRERCLAVPSSSVPDISKSETFLKNFNGHESHFTSVESVVELTSDSASDSPETLADSQALHNTSLSKETQTHEEKPFDNYVFKDPILSKKTTVRVDQIIQKSTDVIIARDFQEWLDINNLSHSSKLRDAIGPIADLQKSFANHLTFEKELGILTKERIRLILESADKDSRLKKAMKKISSIESNSVVSGALDNMERAIESALRDWPMAVKDYKYDIFISYRVKSEAQLANELFLYLQLGKHKGRVFLDQHLLQDGEDWRKGFLDGLKQSKIVVMLVSAAAIEGMKRSNIWLDNLLLEWETGLLASTHGKKCTILPGDLYRSEKW